MTASTTPSRPTASSPSPTRRRLSAAGNVIVTLFLALMVGWALNAPGILKTAEGMPLGWRRDVAVAFAQPIAAISSFLQLDRPRELIQNLTDRGGEDDITVALPSPTTTAPPTTASPGDPSTTTTTVADPRPVFTPELPMRTWIGGDSLAITPGESLLPRLDATGAANAIGPIDGHVATGLARPEVFNWPQHLSEVAAAHDPDALVLTLGSNDDQGLTNAPGGGSVGNVGSAAWIEEYRRRVGGLMDTVALDGRQLFWVGIPNVRDTDRYFRGYGIINQIVAEEAAKRPGRVFYVETFTPLSDPNGAYVDYLPSPSGQLVQVRSADGIHFTRAGANILADEIMRIVGGAANLTGWRDPPSTTAPAAVENPG